MKLKLDADQIKAVEHFQGPALVVAGPGSGKTTVIKERILSLIQKHDVDPEHILAIAFTNAAAEEMEKRLRSEQILNHKQPKICTLHVFGKDLITDYPEQAGFKEAPYNVWDADDIGQIINKEKYQLLRATYTALVAIYKFEGMTTRRCYIGQTIDPERREWEHRTYSSNRELRDALQKGDEKFEFKVIAKVNGQNADKKETDYINLYRNSAAVNLGGDIDLVEGENPDIPVTIYKIKSRMKVTCYIGYSIEPEWSKEFHFTHSPNRILREAIENEGVDQFTYEIIDENVPWARVPMCVSREIAKHRNWAVFNRQDPLQAGDSNRRRIEIFCEYFDVPFDEVIEHTQKFRDLMNRFNTMKDDIEKVKRQVNTGLFAPDEIADPVLRSFAKRYEDIKTEAKAIDFLDMLIRSAYMLEKYPELLHEYRAKYRYVFVDEFQDISPVDFRLINLFPDNLFAVGDDDQAIYGFRGGDSQIMQEKFGKRKNVANYEITRNYRSTSSVVKHSRSLIAHNNPHRFSKNLRAKNPVRGRICVLKTSPDTIEKTLLNELLPVVTVCETHLKENTPHFDNLLLQKLTVPQKTGVLARNWYEVKKTQQILQSSESLAQFKVVWSETDDTWKRKMILQRGEREIEVCTIHSAKGKEWEKVILIVNTIANASGKPYVSLPDSRNNLTEERQVFYVAITRAKQELVILGRNCQFISEFQNVRPIEIVESIESEIKKELEEVSQKALEDLKSKLKHDLKEEGTTVLKQSDELNRLQSDVAEAENAVEQMEMDLPKQLKASTDDFLEGLVPVLDEFESQIKNLSAINESNDGFDDFSVFTESVRRAHGQLRDSLKNHGLKPIEACGKIFNSSYHEKVSPDIYSGEVQVGKIANEEQRGYLLRDRAILKAQVVVSKGQNIWTPEQLDEVTTIYLDRIIYRCGERLNLGNIDKPFIKRKMARYLLDLDNESIAEISSFAAKSVEAIGDGRFADYCIGPEKTHLCTHIFRDFWNCMWQVVEQSRKNPETKIALSSKPESFKGEPAEPPTDKPTPILEIESKRSDEPPKLRVIKSMNKTVVAMPMIKKISLVLESQRVPLYGQINLIVSKPVKEVIDTPTPMSKDFSEILDTCVQELKPETLETLKTKRVPLDEPIDLIVPEPTKEVVDSRLPMPKDFSEIPNSQIQNLILETLEIEIVSKHREAVNNNSQSTPQEREDILNTHIKNLKPETLKTEIASEPLETVNNNVQTLQEYENILNTHIKNLKPETSETKNPNSVTQESTLETEADSDTRPIKGQDSSEDKSEYVKKNLGYYLRQGGRFAVEKIKGTIFRKPTS